MLKRLVNALSDNPWEAFAQSINARYIDGGLLKTDKVLIQESFYSITISLGTNQRGNMGFMYTRFRCSYCSSQAFYFNIQAKSIWKKLFHRLTGRHASLHPIERQYSIRSNDNNLLNALFQDNMYWSLFALLPPFKLVSEKDDGLYGPDFKAEEHQLCLELEREIQDHELLNTGVRIVRQTMLFLEKNHLLKPVPSSVNY